MSAVAELLGRTLTDVAVARDRRGIDFTLDDGRRFRMYSDEVGGGNDVDVWVEDICGAVTDLLGSPLLVAEEATRKDNPHDGVTWTFYRFATIKGYITIRWCGRSNGYYSESVDFEEIKP